MIKTKDLTVISNEKIAPDVYKMRFSGCDGAKPGQFVNIQLSGKYLRRPISVYDFGKETGILTIVYKTVGKGTKAMAEISPNDSLNVMYSLGNGYDLTKATENTTLVGGGVGIPPLYYLAKELIKTGIKPKVLLGHESLEKSFLVKEFENLDLEVAVTTVDGTLGTKGFVTDAIPEGTDYIYTCGPEPMLKALHSKGLDGQYSFEERMGCGFGVCVGCSCKTIYGSKRICVDGPVLTADEILWEVK